MDHSTRTLGTLLRRLGIALLDATLLLALALAIAAIVLLGRVQNFAADTAAVTRGALGPAVTERLGGDLDRLGEAADRLASIDARLAALQAAQAAGTAPGEPELAALRDELAGLTARFTALNATLDEIRVLGAGSARALLAQIMAALAPTAAPPPVAR